MEEVLSSNAEQFLNQNNAFSALLSDEAPNASKVTELNALLKKQP